MYYGGCNRISHFEEKEVVVEARMPEVLKAMTIDMTFERREELIRRDERQEGRLEVLLDLVREGSIDIVTAATKANMSVEKFETMLA